MSKVYIDAKDFTLNYIYYSSLSNQTGFLS